MKILLVRNDNIGDLVCTTPAIEALKKKYPDAQIDIVVNSYNYMAIDKNPYVDTIYSYTKPKHKKGIFNKIKALFGKIGMMSKIFFTKYDVSVVFRSGYSSSAEQFSNLSRAKMRIGVKDKNNKDNFTHHITLNPNHNEVEFCFDCLEPLDVKYDGEKTVMYVPDEFIKKYDNYKDIIVFHVSSRVNKNKMSFEKLKDILLKLDEKIYITAEPKDFKMAEKLDNETKAVFIQTSSLLDLGGLIKHSKLFIALEGGTTHLGPAIGVKTMALFGSSNINKWYPWGYKDLVIQDESRVAENIDNDLIVKKIKENI